ncbi:nucleotidyltransferase [Ralstonia phage RSB3]|uniref:Nucleotidyltransferase n=1 Tax=Ralstonia phage RSB3 TaxID=1402875 RepID=U3TM33_9CAUD|nr:nucleotidyltransferase [Ralstonia phage RSB3]BAN92339.1 hypothetical protein [Ralstonia phage RSB3]
MSAKLAAVRDFIHRLADYGVIAVCVGGAARDTFLGREPKDFDLVILSQHKYDPLLEWIKACSEYGVRELGSDAESYQADERELAHVYETGVTYDTSTEKPLVAQVQILVYSDDVTGCWKGNPEDAVEEHDCDLNKAWFEQRNGKLVPRVHYSFPSPYTGNVNTFRSGTSADRISYIKAKFPEFNHTV